MIKSEGLVVPDRVYTVGELTQVIRLDLESSFPRVWVEGEISNFKLHSSGHRYFTLKDKDASLQSVIWRSDGARLKFDLRDGQQVVCRGKISVYVAKGEYQLIAEATSEKIALGWHLDGKVSAVVGTHTHVPTADERVLPGGTAYITDVGMAGGRNSVIGIKREQSVEKFLSGRPMRFEPSNDGSFLSAVVIEIDAATGRARSIVREVLAEDGAGE